MIVSDNEVLYSHYDDVELSSSFISKLPNDINSDSDDLFLSTPISMVR